MFFNSEHIVQDIGNPFLDQMPAERVRSQILKYRSEADHVPEIHKRSVEPSVFLFITKIFYFLVFVNFIRMNKFFFKN